MLAHAQGQSAIRQVFDCSDQNPAKTALLGAERRKTKAKPVKRIQAVWPRHWPYTQRRLSVHHRNGSSEGACEPCVCTASEPLLLLVGVGSLAAFVAWQRSAQVALCSNSSSSGSLSNSRAREATQATAKGVEESTATAKGLAMPHPALLHQAIWAGDAHNSSDRCQHRATNTTSSISTPCSTRPRISISTCILCRMPGNLM